MTLSAEITAPASEGAPYGSVEECDAAYANFVSKGHVGVLRDSPMAPHSVHFGRRENGKVQDLYSGRWYFDCHRCGSLFNLGHRHPEIIQAAKDSLDHVDAGSFSQISVYRAQLAQKLSHSTGGALRGSIFGCNGGDAIDIAAQAARQYTGRSRFISIADTSFHGHNEFGLAVSGISGPDRGRYRINSDLVTFVPYNDLDAMRTALASDDIAAVVMEPTPAQGGFPDADTDYLKSVKAACEQAGALLILDEVQTGMGSCGTFWSYESDGYVPDIIAVGKGLGGGVMAIAAAIMSEPVWRAYADKAFAPHGSTYGGSENACIVASKAVDLTMEPTFLAHVRVLADRFRAGFADAPYRVSQRGLCLGLWVGDSLAATAALGRNGVLTIPSADAPVLPFRPILTISEDEADEIISIVRQTLG